MARNSLFQPQPALGGTQQVPFNRVQFPDQLQQFRWQFFGDFVAFSKALSDPFYI